MREEEGEGRGEERVKRVKNFVTCTEIEIGFVHSEYKAAKYIRLIRKYGIIL